METAGQRWAWLSRAAFQQRAPISGYAECSLSFFGVLQPRIRRPSASARRGAGVAGAEVPLSRQLELSATATATILRQLHAAPCSPPGDSLTPAEPWTASSTTRPAATTASRAPELAVCCSCLELRHLR